jgi:hypothetical protein
VRAWRGYEIIESTLAGGPDFRRGQQFAQGRAIGCSQVDCVMRMYAGGGPVHGWVGLHDRDCGTRAGERTASDDHVLDARQPCGIDDFLPVTIEAVVGQVQADVDECGCRAHARGAVIMFAASCRGRRT